MKDSIETRDDIMELVSDFRASRIVLTAFELDLFTLVERAPVSAQAAAGAAGIDPRAAEILLDSLVAIGLMKKAGGEYANTEISSRCLVRGKDDYMAGLALQIHLWDSWSRLTDIVRTGRPAQGVPVGEREERWIEDFIAAMHDRGKRQAEEVAGILDLDGVERILDVGGGSGIFAATFAAANEKIRAVVFDLPAVVPITRRYLSEHPAGDRVDTMTGDYLEDDLGSGYDIVFLSAIVHSNSPEDNQALVEKCARALNPGGRVCIVDFVTSEDHTEPLTAALFSVNMLVNTGGGRSYSFREISSWLKRAGLGKIDYKPMERGLGLVTGSSSG